ncbi:MAG: dTMP kinase [bacterium]
MNKFIVIEGLDGAGKSTQIGLLRDFLTRSHIDHQYIHFPRTDSPIYGEMIASYLRGEYGNIQDANPYLISLIYAGDRNDAKSTIQRFLDKDILVLVDRYVYSNIAFQCAKLNDKSEKEKLKRWILCLEYEYNKIPKPVLSIYLHVPFEFVSGQLKKTRSGHQRSYLNGKNDIHESSLDFQKKVETEYIRLLDELAVSQKSINQEDMRNGLKQGGSSSVN